ncbi:MAG: helix-turn-helix transcriptional regulator, partial [Actinobacteria bacterium]|nr:helix-turn-helix transcriptional regulator [Actinomycetota bacterium]
AEVDALRARHLQHFMAMAETYYAERSLVGSDAGLQALAGNRDNFRAALRWAADVDADAALRLTATLDDFWRMISAAEGWEWLQRTLAAAPRKSPYRTRALLTAGMLAAYVPAYAEGAGLLDEAASAARQRGDRSSEAWAELWLGRLAFFAGDPARAEAHLGRAVAAHEALDSRLGLVRSLCLLGLLEALVLHRHAEGEEKLRRALQMAGELGDSWGQGYANMMLGLCAADLGHASQAEAHGQAALRAPALGPLLGVPLQAMAHGAVERDPGRAMRLLGAAAGHFARSATTPPPFLQQRSDATREHAGRLLGLDAACRAYEEGRSMTTDEALVYARSGSAGPRPQGPLTRREAQVAALVALGHTNREIAAVLHLSVRTVESHVDHSLSKLGLRNRTQLAGWAAENLEASRRPRNP